MGFSLVGAFAILSVSLMIGLQIFTGSLLPAVSESNESFRLMKNRIVNQTLTNITIYSTSTSANESNYDLNVTVNNTGGVTLTIADFHVLINGTVKSFNCSKAYLYPTNHAFINVTNLPGTGIRTLKIVTENGITDYVEYTISV